MKNKDQMAKEREIFRKNGAFSLMHKRNFPLSDEDFHPCESLDGITDLSKRLKVGGGYYQQNRMIKDKRRSLDKAVFHSYQGAFVQKFYESDQLDESGEKMEAPITRALINPNKLTQDYDEKIISSGFENEYKTGDIIEWMDTDTYWLIYLQDLNEAAYFRANMRKCSIQIKWKNEQNEIKSTFAAVRGPVETKIQSINKMDMSIDLPNYSLRILMPKNEDTIKYFKRYAKFYLRNTEASDAVCWKVEAVNNISIPGIISIDAIEDYANKDEDNIAEGIVGGLIPEKVDPNDPSVEKIILGETFIKPKMTYIYQYKGEVSPGLSWIVEKNLPIKYSIKDATTIELKWMSTFSGQFELKYGDIVKTIVVESLF